MKTNKKSMLKKAAALGLAVSLIATCLTGFTTKAGLGNVYQADKYEIFDNTYYTHIKGEHTTNGIESAHIVEADIKSGKLKAFVMNGEVRSTARVSDYINYIENLGYKVVAAINGDIFDTSSGTSKGLVIHDGNIVTSGYSPDRVFAFTNDGEVSLEPAQLDFDLSCTIEYQNPVTSTSAVLVPITKEITVTEAAIDEATGEPVLDENGQPVINERIETITEYEEQQTTETVYETVTEEKQLDIGFFNVPHGGANALHVYNRHYGTSTKTTGVNAEAVIEVENVQFKVNGTIKGIVKSVGTSTANTAIGDNEIVLSTVQNSATYRTISMLKQGSEIEIKITDPADSNLKNAKEAVGIYYSLVEDGRNATVGGTLNPRTAIGVKSDGTFVMAEIDGRQASVSKGLGLYDLADMMIDYGCSYAVNLDGGGSSVMYVRKAGENSASARISSPSEGSERKVANAIILAYKAESVSSAAKHLTIKPSSLLAMPGASIELSVSASNANYEAVSVPGSVTYSVSGDGNPAISGNVLTAGTVTGTNEVTANASGATGSKTISVVNDIIIKPSVSKISVEAGETRDINVNAYYGSSNVNVPVACNDSMFKFSCDENIGTIDKDGVFTASIGNAQTGKITVSYGAKSATIDVHVGANIIVFADTAEHWAKEYIGRLAGLGYLAGMGENKFEPDGNLTRAQFIAMLAKINNTNISEYAKSSQISTDVGTSATGSEITATDSSIEVTTGNLFFTDVSAEDWFYPYVKWGVSKGITNGMGDGTFAPNAQITREQMSVMLLKYAQSIGFMIPQTTSIPAFTDYNQISSWSINFVLTAAGAGILSGFDTGEFMPQGSATRAQAAKVIYVFAQLREII